MPTKKSGINKIYAWIRNNTEQVLNVYYNSGLIRQFYPLNDQLPKTVCSFIGNAKECFLSSEIKLYYQERQV